ncbi:sensor histidine kinase [Paenibacillus senegalensis]|uniref:sensor histidine kinase n=1 Tax=Paenibacillus senegalensis TaxID=1465766 RepID=UPI00028980A1|nr:histidine kinase [Paenibacillus senegalensis]
MKRLHKQHKLHKQQRRFSIFSKLVVAFLVVISPLYALGYFINEKGAETVKNEITKSLNQQAQFYLMSLENEIERMTVLQREFMNDEDLESLSMLVERMSNYEKLFSMKKLHKRLSLIKASSMYISAARAYIPSVSRTVSSNRLVDPLDQVQIDRLKEEAFKSAPPFIYSDNRMFIREYYPTPFNLDRQNPAFILELEISIPALQSYLQQLPGHAGGGAVLIHEDVVIASSHDHMNDEIIKQMMKDADPDTNTVSLFLQNRNYLTVIMESAKLNSSMVVYVPEHEVMGPIQKYRLYLFLISGISLVTLVVFAYWIYRIIHRPLRKLVGAFRKVEAGLLHLEIKHNSHDEFQYLYERFNHMTAHLNKLIYEVYEQQLLLQKSELKQLQSQINPHFLYNSFYLLYRMTKAQDYENSTRFTKYLGDYFQYITRNGKEEVRLEEEFHHVKVYTEIQSIRFHERIHVSLGEIPERYLNLKVPRLILQPIVENVYQHGLDHDGEDRRLAIHIQEAASSAGSPLLLVIVEDNGRGLSEEEVSRWSQTFKREHPTGEVTGMLNVHRRLRLKYGKDAGLSIENAEPSGLRVILALPVELSEEA